MKPRRSRQNLFVALAVASLALAGIFTIGSNQLAVQAREQRRRASESLIALGVLNERKGHTEALVREFVLVGTESLAVRVESGVAEIHRYLTQARRSLDDDPDQIRRLERLDAVLKELTERWTLTLATHRRSGQSAATRIIIEGVGRRLSDEAGAILSEMEAEETRDRAESRAHAEHYGRLCNYGAIAGGVLAVLFGHFALRTLNRQKAALAATVVQIDSLRRRLELIHESVGDGLHGLSLDGTINFENPAAERMLGYARGELLGRPAHATIHHHHADGAEYPVAQCPIYATMRDGETRTVRDEVFWRKDGTSFPVEYIVAPVTDEKGVRAGAIVAFRDVSERQEQELALRRAHAELEERVRERTAALELERAKLAAVFENMETGVVFSNPQGGDIVLNAAALRMHGFASREDIHAHVSDYAKEWELRDAAGRVLPFAEWPLPRAIAGVFCRGEEIHLRNLQTGHEWDCSYTAMPVSDFAGATNLIVLTLTDITESKRAEKALREREAQLREAQRIGRMGSWQLDLVANRLEWSDEIFRIFEIDPRQFGASYGAFLEAIHPDDRETVNQAYTESVRLRTPYEIEHRLRMPDGRIKFVQERCETDYDATGKPLRSRGTVLDITERKRAEEEIRTLNTSLERRVAERTRQLEEINQELTAFSYSVSHDLRSPLRGIDGFTQVLEEDYADRLDDTGRGHLARVRAAAQRMSDLIDDLLKLSKITRAELHRQRVDLSRLARTIATDLGQREPQRQVAWAIADGLAVDGDPQLLRVALENLLGNAWKFTGRRPDARIEFGAAANAQGRAFFVRDNGAGFDMAHVGKLFGAFQRLHGRSEFEGTGIGLATVQRILHRHGGRVWAEGTVNGGATFYFTL